MKQFVEYCSLLKGDEKGEAQVFTDRLFRAFGHPGYKEAGATLEHRIRKRNTATTSFADLVWPGKLLLEMKKRGAKLNDHLQQAFEYWISAVPNRPRYVALCNFDELWIYDFDKQIDVPVDVVRILDLPKRYTALNFLFPDNPRPIFGNDRVAVTREAADKVAAVFRSLMHRGEQRASAQRFVLQTVVAMFSEDMDLLPAGTLHRLIEDCKAGHSAYDLFGALFRQMNTPTPARGGRFQGVPYFNGGLFGTVDPCELDHNELTLLSDAASTDWAKVNPAIFGTLFQDSMDAEERHAYGAHFTSEADILRVVLPTIVRPWRDRIEAASTLRDLVELRKELVRFRILDPACGSGNFLYVSYRELVRLEVAILQKIENDYSSKALQKHVHTVPSVSTRQFYGIEMNSFGVELAKVTLMLAKKLAIDEAVEALRREQSELGLDADEALPLDNLDDNFITGDALFVDWPPVDAVVGNPPYQSKNKMQGEFGRAYVNRLRARFPDVPGRADYCVYWFRRAHDELQPGKRAGLVGTNTIRENYSRDGGLNYIVSHGGTITEAVSSQVWSGDADVHVSIVNWTKQKEEGTKRLFRQLGDRASDPWEMLEVPSINAALSFKADVTSAKILQVNKGKSYQGQTHGHEGFLLTPAEASAMIQARPGHTDVLFPYLTGDELLSERSGQPCRYVIDFGDRDLIESQQYDLAFKHVKFAVLVERERRATEEQKRNDDALHEDPYAHVVWDHRRALDQWWKLFRRRGDLLSQLNKLSRYVVCPRVTKRPIFAFVSSLVHPNDALAVFPFEDDYSFGVLQSGLHWEWFTARCSTLTARYRYTSNTVFDTFPWPQAPDDRAVAQVAKAAVALRKVRSDIQAKLVLPLRDVYRGLDQPGKHPLKDAQEALDAAVRRCYGMGAKEKALEFLLTLNLHVSSLEDAGSQVTGPGLPPGTRRPELLITADCVEPPPLYVGP